MKRIHISQLKGAESINKINNDLYNFLSEKGLEVTHSEIPKYGEILIQHFYNEHIVERAGHRFKKIFLIQPIDGDILNKNVIDAINKYEFVITPSNSCKKIFLNNGIDRPIIVIPNYYDDSILTSDNGYYASNYKSLKYTFYSESTGIKRKNLPNILKYFLSEFTSKDSVRLILKITTKDKKVIEELNKILTFCSVNIPEVVIINEFLSDDNLNSLRRGIDCYVCLSYMEGFCIPLLNSIVLHKDIICFNTEISGYSDFINKDNAYLLDVKKIPIDASVENLRIYSKNAQWEQPDYSEYQKSLRILYNKQYPFDKNTNKYDSYSQEYVMNQYLSIIENN